MRGGRRVAEAKRRPPRSASASSLGSRSEFPRFFMSRNNAHEALFFAMIDLGLPGIDPFA